MKQVVTQTFRACFKISKQQQQVEQARLAKKTKKARLEKKRLKVFICKRCFVKFSNNIKFHKHV